MRTTQNTLKIVHLPFFVDFSKKQLHIQRKQEKTLEDVRAILKGE
jgi:hypothetical protein